MHTNRVRRGTYAPRPHHSLYNLLRVQMQGGFLVCSPPRYTLRSWPIPRFSSDPCHSSINSSTIDENHDMLQVTSVQHVVVGNCISTMRVGKLRRMLPFLQKHSTKSEMSVDAGARRKTFCGDIYPLIRARGGVYRWCNHPRHPGFQREGRFRWCLRFWHLGLGRDTCRWRSHARVPVEALDGRSCVNDGRTLGPLKASDWRRVYS